MDWYVTGGWLRRSEGAPRVAAPRASLHVGLDPLGPARCTATERPPRRGGGSSVEVPKAPFTGDNPVRITWEIDRG